jgi:phytol kinase
MAFPGVVLEQVPGWEAWAAGVPPAAVWMWGWCRLAGYLKLRKGWRTGYTRKVVHFSTFLMAAAAQMRFGVGGVYVFGTGASLVLAWAIWRGDGNPCYEAIAREKDRPHRTLFIVIPYVTTVVGGLAGTAMFGQWAVVGYLVGGVGDAVGEPVGVRFGRHRYRVPCIGLETAERSLEGSLAVLAVSWAGAVTGIWLVTGSATGMAGAAALVAIASAVAEAVSPHGWDNLTLQVLPAWLGWWLAG